MDLETMNYAAFHGESFVAVICIVVLIIYAVFFLIFDREAFFDKKKDE